MRRSTTVMDSVKFEYKWIVLIMSYLNMVLTFGVSFSVAVLYSEWNQYFKISMNELAFAGGMQCSIASLSGPICSVIIHCIGIRKSVLLGGSLMSCGILLSFFAESVVALCLTFGVIAGLGAGLASLGAAGALNTYFRQGRTRTLAESVVAGGMCSGVFFFSTLLRFLINLYGWKGAVLILGGMCLNHLVFGMFFWTRTSSTQLSTLNNSQCIGHRNEVNDKKSYDCGKKTKREINSKENNTSQPQLFVVKQDSRSLSERSLETPTKKNFLKRSWKLWKNPTFIILNLCELISSHCWFVPYVHIVERARLSGIDENTSAWISSLIGLSGVIGRPFTGFMFTRFHVHPFHAYIILQIAVGIVTLTSSFWADVYGLFVFAFAFGFLNNGYGLIKASTAIMLGVDHYVDAFSWISACEGIGILMGPVLAGWLYDITGSYMWSFRVAGMGIILSGLVALSNVMLNKFFIKNKLNQENHIT